MKLQPHPMLILSPLELELLLNKNYEKILEFYKAPSRNSRDLYLWNKDFLKNCNDCQETISEETLLKIPQIVVRKVSDSYIVEYNSDIQVPINNKLSDILSAVPKSKHFVDQFNNFRKYRENTQIKIVEYLIEIQKEYLDTNNPLHLKDLEQKDVAKNFEMHPSTISRLIRNLSIKLPEENIIFASYMIPSKHILAIKGAYALSELQKNSNFYRNGIWKASCRKLAIECKERFGLDIAGRTMGKYVQNLNSQKAKETGIFLTKYLFYSMQCDK